MVEVSTGQVFGRLTVLELVRQPPSPSQVRLGKSGARAARCQCECGKETVSRIYDLVRGNIQSCGCLRDDLLRERSRTHGYGARDRTKRHPLYGLWLNMKNRCENTKALEYRNYGGRGIRVCERWQSSFENFLADIGERPPGTSLDRINNDGNYEPGNVRWATRREQSLNRRAYKHMTSILRVQLLIASGNNWPALVD